MVSFGTIIEGWMNARSRRRSYIWHIDSTAPASDSSGVLQMNVVCETNEQNKAKWRGEFENKGLEVGGVGFWGLMKRLTARYAKSTTLAAAAKDERRNL